MEDGTQEDQDDDADTKAILWFIKQALTTRPYTFHDVTYAVEIWSLNKTRINHSSELRHRTLFRHSFRGTGENHAVIQPRKPISRFELAVFRTRETCFILLAVMSCCLSKWLVVWKPYRTGAVAAHVQRQVPHSDMKQIILSSEGLWA
jgi:hypothetical protein